MAQNNPILIIDIDGTQRVVQFVGIMSSNGEKIESTEGALNVLLQANGQNTGTLFGDDIKTTRRVPVLATKYSQGLPTFAVDSSINGSGYWEVVNVGGVLNGASEFGTGTDADGKIFISSKTLNRYEPGQLSYYLFTAAFDGKDNANGNFELFVGAVLRGTASEGKSDQIKEGFVFGCVKDSEADARRVFRVYKNYIVISETVITEEQCSVTPENLNIFHLTVGYLGIHPTELKYVDTVNGVVKTAHYEEYNQNTTNVNDPNLAVGIYAANLGNTANITLRNGSLQFGNYAERPQPDASSRPLIDEFSVASILAGTDIVLAAYTVPEFVEMVQRHDLGGDTLDTFRNTIGNRLRKVQAVATPNSNKTITLNFYFIPKEDITATFTDLVPGVNVLQRALAVDITAITLANAQTIGRFIINIARGGANEDVADANLQLTSDTVAVLTVSSDQASSDFSAILNTEDLF